jgi:FkbM family methyltransferase
MNEISWYVNTYQNGLFIEAIPDIFKQLTVNLQHTNQQYNTNYIPINCLVSDVPDKEYTFNIFSNDGASSSIYEPNLSEWKWPDVKKIDTIQLTLTTIDNILKEYDWGNGTYDVLLDVQGAELDVLKGISDDNFKNIQTIKTE